MLTIPEIPLSTLTNNSDAIQHLFRSARDHKSRTEANCRRPCLPYAHDTIDGYVIESTIWGIGGHVLRIRCRKQKSSGNGRLEPGISISADIL